MKRIDALPLADPHDVVVIGKPHRTGWRDRLNRERVMDVTQGVTIDGMPLCIPQGSEVLVSHTADGFSEVTITIVAATVDHARLPIPPKRKRPKGYKPGGIVPSGR